MECMAEIQRWHREKVEADFGDGKKAVEYNPKPWAASTSYEDWLREGKPHTWSPLLDHMLTACEPHYRASMGKDRQSMARYYETFCGMLVRRRGDEVP
jgi:hypothetical protein